MLAHAALYGLGAAGSAAWWVTSTAHRAISLLPGYNCLSGVVLDTVLGPEQDFEYVSTTTAPSAPPPTIS